MRKNYLFIVTFSAIFICSAKYSISETYMNDIIEIISRQAITPSGTSVCLINLLDKSQLIGVKDLTAVLYESGFPKLAFGPLDLAPDQSIVLVGKPYAATACVGESVFFRVSFRGGKQREEALLPVSIQSGVTPSVRSNWWQLGTSMVGTISLLIGTLLGHWLALSRERRQEMMRQRIQTFEKEADAIHRFIADWQRIPTADALGRNYATLRSNMRVPEKIKIAYRKTSSILNDQSLDLNGCWSAIWIQSTQLSLERGSILPLCAKLRANDGSASAAKSNSVSRFRRRHTDLSKADYVGRILINVPPDSVSQEQHRRTC